MILIIGVRFRKSSKVYYFDPTGYDIKKGDHVIVETARGIEYGTVVLGPKEVTDDKVVSPLKPLTRPATPEDEKTNIENEKKEKEAYQICLEKINKHDLKMKLIDSEYTFDRNKLLFYFTADGRIDFRELVKDLASVFRTRIELRQIGVRDETKLLGGMAICGRPLCCHTFLSEFAPVSIKMAKEQGLSLNPTQISGVCGRLMCCLKNEQEAYEELNHSLPSIGSQVKTIDGYTGEVQSTSVLKQLVKIVITKKNGEREIREYPVADLSFKDHQISNEGSELEASLNEMVVNIAGDGCFRMNMNEIATATRSNIPIIELIFNNSVLGMVRQWQTLFYGERYSHTILKDKVDYVKVAEAMGARAYRITKMEEVEPVLKEALAAGEPVVIDCVIESDDKVFPMVAPGKNLEDVFDEEDLNAES